MNGLPVEVGGVVLSKAGRDRGRMFLVIEEVDDDFVMVANGDTRKMDRLKKKRRRHLKPTGHTVQALRDRLLSGQVVQDHELRAWLREEEEKLVQV